MLSRVMALIFGAADAEEKSNEAVTSRLPRHPSAPRVPHRVPGQCGCLRWSERDLTKGGYSSHPQEMRVPCQCHVLEVKAFILDMPDTDRKHWGVLAAHGAL